MLLAPSTFCFNSTASLTEFLSAEGTGFTEFYVYNLDGSIIASTSEKQVGKIVSQQPYFDPSLTAEYIQPPLTSVRQPIREAGRKCVETLVALLRGQAPASAQVLLRPELIVRQSSGAFVN